MALYYKTYPERFKIPSLKILIPISLIGIALTGITGIMGGIWKVYNDIPSLFGYMGMALIIYKLEITPINKFFSYINKVSYEWYLVHILVFVCSNHILDLYFNASPIIKASTALFTSYFIAILYNKLLKKLNVV